MFVDIIDIKIIMSVTALQPKLSELAIFVNILTMIVATSNWQVVTSK